MRHEQGEKQGGKRPGSRKMVRSTEGTSRLLEKSFNTKNREKYTQFAHLKLIRDNEKLTRALKGVHCLF